MSSFSVDPSDPTPLYAQLERRIRSAIAAGSLRQGERLPTVRQMAVDLVINANTVAKVYAQLERDGYIETRRGIGSFVREGAAPVSTKPSRERELRQFARRYLDDGAALGFSFNEMLKQLHHERR